MADDLNNLRLVGIRIGERLLAGDIGEEDGDHVLADFRIKVGKIGQVETAMHIGIPPGEQEIGDAPALPGVAVGDVEQLPDGETDAVFHGKRPFAERDLPQITCVDPLD